MQFCKLPRFVKPESEIQKVKDVIRKYFKYVKESFPFIISRSQYPTAREAEYREWVSLIGIDDSKMDLTAIERDFKATNFVPDEYKVDGVTQPSNTMNRQMFLEIISRMAKARFEVKG